MTTPKLGALAHSQIDREPATSPLRGSAWMPHQPRASSRLLPRGRSWHNNMDDRLTRKLMMLRLRRLHPVLAGTKCTTVGGGAAVVPSLVQRLEWMLYNAAYSMHEYTHEQSLERRVQALVTQLEPKVATDQRRQERTSKRGRDKDHSPDTKRKEQRLMTHNNRTSVFLLENDDNLVGLVLSFLSGRTVLRLRSVNRFMWEKAPTMVSTLHLETHAPALQHFSSGTLTTLLLRCSKLTTLVVTSKLHEVEEARTMVHRRPSFSRPPRRDGRLKNGFLAGELMLRDITRAFEQGACPELQELDLGSPLDYFAESDDVLSCLGAFATGRQRGVGAAGSLRYLRLDSTYLGDARLSRLADAFETNCFGSLKTLVLRNNFIGEAGCQALLRMLRCLPALRVLDVSGNILTDLDALALADWISCRADTLTSTRCCEVELSCWKRPEAPAVQLRTLLLQDNFIGQEGLEALSTVLNARLIPS